MSRITCDDLVRAVARVRGMDAARKEQLVDQLFRVQPYVVASFLVQKQLGVSLEKMDFLVDMVLICFEAMKESGLTWPLITEDEQDRQMARFVATVQFRDDLRGSLRDRVLRQYIETHPEKDLLAFVQVETANWLKRVVPNESDKYVVMAAFNFANCIAFAPMLASTLSDQRTNRIQR
jgi:hypothetical protein